jgi:hypothetical protein
LRLPASFFRGAAAGALGAVLFLFAPSDAFFGTGLPRIVQVLVFVLGDVGTLAIGALLARGLQSLARRFPGRAFVVLAAAASSLFLLRSPMPLSSGSLPSLLRKECGRGFLLAAVLDDVALRRP